MTRARRIQSTPALEAGKPQNQDPSTEKKILDVAKMISEGKTRQSVVSYLMDTYGYTDISQPSKIYNAAVRHLMPTDMEAHRQELIEININRLETIIERGMSNNADLRVAKEAIAELNKMLGITGNKVAIGKENADGTKEAIVISFD